MKHDITDLTIWPKSYYDIMGVTYNKEQNNPRKEAYSLEHKITSVK